MPRLGSSRRTYDRLAANQDDTSDPNNVGASNALDEPLSPSFADIDDDTDGASGDVTTTGTNDNSTSTPFFMLPIDNEINVILMDSAQTKFSIQCDPHWKISEFKKVSASVTKVPPESQRLIHMGKLLQDDSTLKECRIDENDKIIHLFPKPNVVIHNSANDGSTSAEGGGDENNATTGQEGGAHVPQIILDSEEASRRSQILILSSQEIFEAQHRVKIFSFLLMIISSMELLTLMTLFVGVQAEDPTGYGGGSASDSLPPGNPTDTPPSSGEGGMQMRTWQESDYFDTLISVFGVYVALLGLKATTENTLQLATRYFICLVVAGIGSNCYYYYLNVHAEKKHALDKNQPIASSEMYTTAFLGILLPLTVWCLCIVRGYQFQTLIREAEAEAEERTTQRLNGEGSGDHDSSEGEAPISTSLPYGSDDLELGVSA